MNRKPGRHRVTNGKSKVAKPIGLHERRRSVLPGKRDPGRPLYFCWAIFHTGCSISSATLRWPAKVRCPAL